MSKKIRITNTTARTAKGGPGFGLEFQGHYIAANRPLVVDIPVIPVILEDWQAKGWIRIEDAEAAPLSAPGEAEVTPGTTVAEVSATEVLSVVSGEDDLLTEEEFDLAIAKEATMPAESLTAGYNKVNVSLGSTQDTISSDMLSPIPGDRPRHIGDAEKFTVRAPRATAVGGIVKA